MSIGVSMVFIAQWRAAMFVHYDFGIKHTTILFFIKLYVFVNALI